MSPNSKPSLVDTKLPTFAVPPASPQSPRKLRKFQSHQSLTSTSFSSFGQPLATTATAGNNGNGNRQRDSASNGASTEIQSDTNVRPRTRGRSNSESGSGNPTPLTTGTVRTKRPARKTDSSGYSVKRSGLDALLRDGPADGRLMETLQELRLMVLSNRVDADSDGMSTYRIYLWLALLGVSPLLTDEYLALVHRGRSPAYTKIRNDTSRTLATDPLFKRRVTEASLIRLLNAVAWKLHDAQQVTKPSSRPSSRRKELLELAIDSPPTITEEPEGDSVQPIDNPTSKPAIYVQGMNVLCV